MSIETIRLLGRDWAWAKDDERLRVFANMVLDIQRICPYVKCFDTAIQAGGAMGVWAYYLSLEFTQVITFEPHPVNFECLTLNNKERANVLAFNEALGSEVKHGVLKLGNPRNHGTYYVMDTEDHNSKWEVKAECKVTTIDEKLKEIEVGQVGLIQLDIESREVDALQGAINTIQQHKPVIVVEDNQFHPDFELQKPGEAVKYLQSIGYKCVETVHRDKIFLPQ